MLRDLLGDKFEVSDRERIENQMEYDVLKQEHSILKKEVYSHRIKIYQHISYAALKNSTCGNCKKKITNLFHGELINGNPNSDSLVASVVAEKEKRTLRKSMSSNTSDQKSNAKRPEIDSCNCLIS